jgi:hypothetical protein
MIEPKWMARLLPAVALALCAPAGVAAYPGGTPYFVTDVAPYCTSCHSSVSASQFTGVPEQRVQAELADAKHLAKIRGAAEGSPYAKLSAEQRATLLEDVQKIDDASSISLAVPPTLGVGQKFEVTVSAIGGGGPVVGIALVDSNQRWQARPATSAGFAVLDTPSVRDPDGKPQTDAGASGTGDVHARGRLLLRHREGLASRRGRDDPGQAAVGWVRRQLGPRAIQ